jgi:citrate lyase subunit beta/citryl-CoA lyase
MPGVNRRAMDKARGLDCDTVILDLEDAVVPAEKESARALVCDQVRDADYGYREVVIRVNGETTPWHEPDIEAAVKACPDAILVPKVEDEHMARRCVDRIGQAPDAPALWVMIETPAGVANVASIAAVEGVEVLVMGTSDLIKELRADRTPDRQPLLYGLSRSVHAAREHGIDILDGVALDLHDTPGFEAECRQGRALGFDGKTLIHPSQVAPANAAFGPAIEDVEQARRVLAAWEEAESAGRGVAVLDGSMIENLHAHQARRVVAFADALAHRDA